MILDVVYNHLGPDGCYLKLFSEDYFSVRHTTDWGEAINYDGDNCRPVREFFRCNAGYWIAEYHLDGLRLDATQNIYDDSTPHIVADIAAQVKNVAAPRATIVIAENESQDVKLVRPASAGGCGLDGIWNNYFHHSARIGLTGETGGVLYRLPGLAPGADFGGQMGIFVSRAVVHMAKATARHADARLKTQHVRNLPGESRSDLQLRFW